MSGDSLFPEPQLAPSSPHGLGRMMAGGATHKRAGAVLAGANPVSERQANDYYPTPASCTRAFLAAERRAIERACDIEHPIWEPCGRGGAIAAVLEAEGFRSMATDIIADPDHRVTQLDILSCRQQLSPVAITNPPFAIAAEIIRHLLGELEVRYLALLLKATYWHAAERSGLFRWRTPARIHALNWRPDFLQRGAPTMDVIWTVWDANAPSGCSYDVIGYAPGIPMLNLEGEGDE